MADSAVRHLPPLPVDPDLPSAAGLLAGPGAALVAAFLSGRGLEPHRIEPAQAHYRPGRTLTVCFRTGAVDRSTGNPLCPTVTVEVRPDDAGPPAVWAFPDDPALPGLATAADVRQVRRRLRPRPATVGVDPLRYRPRRRAVLRYTLPDTTLFAKVLSPPRARRLLDLAEAFRATGSAPLRLALPVGRIGPGVLVLPGLPGHLLKDLLLRGGPLPDPDRLAALPGVLDGQARAALGALGVAPGGGERRRFDAATAVAAARTVARLLPAEACAAVRLAEAVVAWSETARPVPDRFVHGDLYEGQLLIDGDGIGLLDLDDVGPGDPLLDAANLCAHLLVLATGGGPARDRILRYRADLRTAFTRSLDADPAELAWREAYCILRLATGPFRVLRPDWPARIATRLALAAEALSVRV